MPAKPVRPVLRAALLRRCATVLALLAGLSTPLALAGPTAQASTSLGYEAVQQASQHRGQPYSYGAAGPNRFDCSGLTMYVFARLGRRLPHNAAAQYQSVRHVARSAMRVGDLLFFSSGGSINHVAIYAGNGRMWHAPHSGDVVRLAPIYSSSYLVGRVS